MSAHIYAALSALLAAGVSCAMLPFISLWDHSLSSARRRSLYDKSAGQVESLTALLQILFAFALAADLFFDGCINRRMAGPWGFVWESLVIASAAAALCSVVVLFVRRGGKMAFGLLSGLTALLSACLLSLLVWGGCLGVFTVGMNGEDAAVRSFLIVMDAITGINFLVFAGYSFFLGLTSAYALALCWHILCRNHDDFGRDFYTFTLNMRSRQAFSSGLLLLIAAGAMFWLNPSVDASRALGLLPFAGEYALEAYNAGFSCIPAALAFWYGMMRSELPMQKRSMAFAALLLCAFSAYFVLGRI